MPLTLVASCVAASVATMAHELQQAIAHDAPHAELHRQSLMRLGRHAHDLGVALADLGHASSAREFVSHCGPVIPPPYLNH